MPQLPQLSGPAVPSEQSAGVRLGAPSIQGEGAVIGALGSVANEVASIGLGLLEKQTEIDVLSNESEYGEMMAKAQTELDRNNPSKWPETIKAHSKSFVDQLSSKDLSPAAKQALQSSLGGYESKIMRQVGRDARVAQVQLLTGQFKNRQTIARQNGDYEAERENLRASAGPMGLSEPEIESGLIEINRREKMANYDAEADAGNVEFFENEKLPLNEGDRKRLKKRAELTKQRGKAEDVQKIVAGYEAGVLDFESAMASIEASGLNEVESKNLAKSLQSKKTVSDSERLDFMEAIRELEEGAGEMDADTYTENFLKLRQEAGMLGRRPNADYIQREVDKISPDRLQAADAKGQRLQKDWKEHQLEERMKFSMAHWTDHGSTAFKKIEEATGEGFPQNSAKMEFDREMRKYYKNGGGETKLESEQKAFQVMESIYLDFVDDGFIGSAPGASLPSAGGTMLPTNQSDGGKTVSAQVTRYGYENDKYQNHSATVGGSAYENLGNRNNLLEKGVSIALPPITAKELGVDPKAGEFVEAKISGEWKRFRVDDTAGNHKNHRIDFFDPTGERVEIDGKQVELRKAN